MYPQALRRSLASGYVATPYYIIGNVRHEERCFYDFYIPWKYQTTVLQSGLLHTDLRLPETEHCLFPQLKTKRPTYTIEDIAGRGRPSIHVHALLAHVFIALHSSQPPAKHRLLDELSHTSPSSCLHEISRPFDKTA